jgi:phage-related protein
VRSNLTGGQAARVIFTEEDGSMVLLHGFLKKTRKTPKQDLELALQRKKKEVARERKEHRIILR